MEGLPKVSSLFPSSPTGGQRQGEGAEGKIFGNYYSLYFPLLIIIGWVLAWGYYPHHSFGVFGLEE